MRKLLLSLCLTAIVAPASFAQTEIDDLRRDVEFLKSKIAILQNSLQSLQSSVEAVKVDVQSAKISIVKLDAALQVESQISKANEQGLTELLMQWRTALEGRFGVNHFLFVPSWDAATGRFRRLG